MAQNQNGGVDFILYIAKAVTIAGIVGMVSMGWMIADLNGRLHTLETNCVMKLGSVQ